MDKEILTKEEDLQNIDMGKYAEEYSEDGLWGKIRENVTAIGITLIYKALQLFYVAQSPDCPKKVKAGIYAALGYLISPIDLIPDFTPIAGYADDATAIGMALLLAQMYINDDIKAQARGKIQDLFGMKALAKLDDDAKKQS
ncbi:MAG: DUF1232 domain-containing protein [Selenomonadaceae bacterium]|nr:DUF1232 domain-containing protein [Selenomonadaceae bacterium]